MPIWAQKWSVWGIFDIFLRSSEVIEHRHLHMFDPRDQCLQCTIFVLNLSYYILRLTLWKVRTPYTLVDLDLFSRSSYVIELCHLYLIESVIALDWAVFTPLVSYYVFRFTLGRVYNKINRSHFLKLSLPIKVAYVI